jgi:hypothetical protein
MNERRNSNVGHDVPLPLLSPEFFAILTTSEVMIHRGAWR